MASVIPVESQSPPPGDGSRSCDPVHPVILSILSTMSGPSDALESVYEVGIAR
jgi:hypothetical protein